MGNIVQTFEEYVKSKKKTEDVDKDKKYKSKEDKSKEDDSEEMITDDKDSDDDKEMILSKACSESISKMKEAVTKEINEDKTGKCASKIEEEMKSVMEMINEYKKKNKKK